MEIDLAILLFSALSFVGYGINSFFSKRMISEYERWGYASQRILLGSCQILGGLGLLLGLVLPFMLSLASFLLMCMMITAVSVRFKLKEPVYKMLPALSYALLNLIIFYNSLDAF